MVRKDLGMVTAYAYAVSKGYTGTEAEFAELMASYATVAESAEASAQAAAGSASSAAESATNASGSASAAAGSASAAASSASTASTKASEAATSATAAAGSATTASTKAGEAASSASAAAQSATQAAGSASAAAQSATDANTAKTDAQTAKTAAETAQEKAEEAQAAAEAAAQTLVIDDTLTQANQAAEAKAVGDALKTKAEVDGYYQDMTVGDAEQLISSQYVEDKVPYKYRTSGGSADIGNRAYVDKIVGGTIAWNQLNNNAQSTTTKVGITATKNTDGSWTINGTATANDDITFSTVHRVNGHKYMIFGCPSGGSASTYYVGIGGAVADVGSGGVYAAPNSNDGYFRLDFRTGATFNNVKVYPQYFDLTQMFGPTIADAVYAMEQATAGAGVNWFRSLFPDDYYAYNAGELISVSGLQSHDTVGFNQWDEEWELGGYNAATGEEVANNAYLRSKNFIPVISGATYYRGIGYQSDFRTFYYDADKIYVDSVAMSTAGTFTIPSGVVYIKFHRNGATYKNDICINLSHNGSRNGEYEPYVKHSYPLDSSLTLRGIPKLSADNQLYFDGDEYLPEGKVNRRYGVVVIDGTNSTGWIRQTAYGSVTRFDFTGITGKANGNVVSNLLQSNANIGTRNTETIKLHGDNGNVLLQISTSKLQSDDVAGLMAYFASNPLTIIYELATPTEETAEAYQAIQLVDDWGTEEYVSGTICPVGHETRYPANLRDKLQHLPDLASADGYYVVQQTGSQMSLVHFRIPQAPSADGTYTLKATVSGGNPTYTWEVVT